MTQPKQIVVTGDQGRLGRDIVAALRALGHHVTGFDVACGQDILDPEAVTAAIAGSDVVVHLAAISDDRGGTPQEFLSINVIGTWNVLQAAKEAGAERVVYASSGKALGMLATAPSYLPVDDDHPGGAFRPYGMSKWMSEEMCEAFTRETGIATICLRPVLVLDDDRWPELGAGDELPPARGTAWHLAAFVDQRDAVDAFVRAVDCPDPGHVRLLLCAADVGSDRTALELAAEHFPGVAWRTGRPDLDSRQALIDCTRAHSVLGWTPAVGWRDRPVAV